jgi:hypothetical protein
MSRYCATCRTFTDASPCGVCQEPTTTWAEQLTHNDRRFLASCRIGAGEVPDAPAASPDPAA